MSNENRIRISKDQYKLALSSEGILKERNLELLRVLYDAPNCAATAPQLAEVLGYRNFPPINALVGQLGKRIANFLNITLIPREDNSPGWWQIVADGEQRPEGFTWRLKTPLVEALEELGLLNDVEARLEAGLGQVTRELSEGKLKKIIVNAFERNAVARRLCIAHYQAVCSVCDLDFQEKYGHIGRGFIHVHHLLELSAVREEYKIDPIKDLRPVCPNCHAMLHQKIPAYTINEMRGILDKM